MTIPPTDQTSTDTDPETTDGTSPGAAGSADNDDNESLRADGGHETVDADTRKDILIRDGHQCKFCGRAGKCVGGPVKLEIHHIRRDDDIDEHHPDNLITLGQDCHHWHHQQETDTLPVTLTQADEQELYPDDKKILAVLDEHGPLTTGELTTHLDLEKTSNAVRDRCRLLMGLDNIVSERTDQLVDQHADTGKWGLTHQIDTSARGQIPDNTRILLKRAEDEMVRQMREHGYSREEIGEVVGVTPRTIRKKERSAKAYQFPLDLVAGSEARTDYRNRGGDSCDDEAGVETPQSQAVDDGSPNAENKPPSKTSQSQPPAGHADENPQEARAVWPVVGSLAQVPETEEYVFVLNVSSTHDRLQGIRTTRLSEETCAQIAAAGEPSQLERVADAVRLMTEGPHCSGDADAYEPVPLETVVNPELLMEAPK